MSANPDIILPLGSGSVGGRNDELRLFLRSLEANGRNFGRVWIVTDCPPDWLSEGDGLTVLPVHDRFTSNKDANLFAKVARCLVVVRSEDVILCFDDCAILRPVDFGNLPPIVNERDMADFMPSKEKKDTKWRRRMRATLAELGMETGGNFDAHCPQRWNAEAAREAIRATPYRAKDERGHELGRCIDTAVMGRIHGGRIPANAVGQSAVKATVEGADEEAARRAFAWFAARGGGGGAWFVGYNDSGFGCGLRDWLFGWFPNPARWEAEG